MAIEDRIKELRLSLNLSRNEFGKRLGVSQDVINNIELKRNKNPLSDVFISGVCSVFGVSEAWLCLGEGDMYLSKEETLLNDLQKTYNLSDKATQIIESFVKLPTTTREIIIDGLCQLLNNK